MGRSSQEGDINHKQFGRAFSVGAQSWDRYCRQSFWAKGLERPAKSIGMDIKCLIHLTVELTGE